MTRLIGISGSLRQGSLNSSLLRAAAELAPQGVELAIGFRKGSGRGTGLRGVLFRAQKAGLNAVSAVSGNAVRAR